MHKKKKKLKASWDYRQELIDKAVEKSKEPVKELKEK